VLVSILIREQIIPSQQSELIHIGWPQPPMVGFAFRIQAVIALVWAANLHTSVPSAKLDESAGQRLRSVNDSLVIVINKEVNQQVTYQW
jgi:hypothetical protein